MLHIVKGAFDLFVDFCNIHIPMGFGFDVTVRGVLVFCLCIIVLIKLIHAMTD